MSDSMSPGLAAFLSPVEAPPSTPIAESSVKPPEETAGKPPRESHEERMAALARARTTYPSALVDELLTGTILPWDMEDLWEEMDRDDAEAVRKFLSRKRLAEIIQSGLRAVRIAITKHGPDIVPDTPARASWMKLAMRFSQTRPVRPPREQPGTTPAGQSHEDFFEALRGKPAVRRAIIERLEAMDAEEGNS